MDGAVPEVRRLGHHQGNQDRGGETRDRERERPVVIEDDELEEERIVLGIEEMDRVLGGGLTKGSSVLLGGDPGIGKTTLSFAIASCLPI